MFSLNLWQDPIPIIAANRTVAKRYHINVDVVNLGGFGMIKSIIALMIMIHL
jgi:hypothetical protein